MIPEIAALKKSDSLKNLVSEDSKKASDMAAKVMEQEEFEEKENAKPNNTKVSS